MKVRRYKKPTWFLRRVGPLLETEEVTNNLPLGILLRYAERGAPSGAERPFCAFAEHGGRAAFVMLMTPPHNMILYGAGEALDAAIEVSVTFLIDEGVPLPGVIGPRDVATRFATVWRERTGCALTVRMEQMIYRLDRVQEVAFSPGELIQATDEHVDLAAEWFVDFSAVALEPVELDVARKRIAGRIRAGDLYLWRDGVPVSMSWRARPTRNGVVVSGVYTPPPVRSRGYATSCVATLSQRLLDEGYRYCCLYTDLSNPTSNSIYRKIGYRPERASIVYDFV